MKERLFPRLLNAPNKSFFLLGPRGTGKSTWVRQQAVHKLEFDLLNERLYQSFLTDPEKFADALEACERGSWVFIDEIQRLPNLLNEVHRAIENKKLKFILSGSSARKLRKQGTNLLGGRAASRWMHPLLPEELGKDFSLRKALEVGTLPIIWGSHEPSEALKDYVLFYLKEEIQAEALVRNLAGFSRFLPVAGLFHGQILNVSNVARDAGVERTTVQGYLEVLEDTLMAFRLPAYEGRLRIREKKHPKLFWFDPGVARTVRQEGEVGPENIGLLFEGWIAQVLRSYRDYVGLFDEFYYWSPAEAKETEVDFLLRQGKQFIAIEAKATKRLRDSHFKGLRAIEGLKGLKRRFLVYMGSETLRTKDGIDVLPAVEFARRVRALFS